MTGLSTIDPYRDAPGRMTDEPGEYLSGFGNEHTTEAEPGALPAGQNSPQHVPHGLYTEGFSGTAFTAPRHENLRTWTYRIAPSASHPPFRLIDSGRIVGTPFDGVDTSPNRLRWNPWPMPDMATDFLSGLSTLGGNGDLEAQAGIAIHIYRANRSMERVFFNADGELLLVPQSGRLRLATELGTLTLGPCEIAVVPRGIRFRVELIDGAAGGYVLENYGAPMRLPELGPIGANGLANPRDFLYPRAAYEDLRQPTELVQKFLGRLWVTELDRSPLDVVAWHGNYAPYKYDLGRFNTLGSISFDHPDPSIFTVLTSPSERAGTANADFVIFPTRWLVQEHTFRPPWFHRNVMNEFMGLIYGAYDAKAEGFQPGGASLHNCMAGHGPDLATWRRAVEAELKPHKVEQTLAFMFETRMIIRPTAWALADATLQHDYDEAWTGFPRNFQKP